MKTYNGMQNQKREWEKKNRMNMRMGKRVSLGAEGINENMRWNETKRSCF